MSSTPSLPTAVIDASVAVKWLLPEVHSTEALKLLSRTTTLHAPDLLLPEVGNILWKRVRAGEITAQKAKELLEWLLKLPLQLHPSAPLLLAAVEIACQYDRTVYDSLYLALAVREKSVVVTADQKLVNALSGSPLVPYLVLMDTL